MWDMSFGRARHRLFDMMLEHCYQKKRVTLSSGRESDFYIDCKQVTLSAEGAYLVGVVGNKLLQTNPVVEAVGGLTMGADPMAMAIALESLRVGPYTFQPFVVRKEPKKHGSQQMVEGGRRTSQRPPVAILDDVVTTGQSTINAILDTHRNGFIPRRVLVLVDRQEDNGRENILDKLSKAYISPIDSGETKFEAVFTREDFERGSLL